MKTINLLYEGKAKKIYSTESEDLVVVEYKDDATAFNGEKKSSFEEKGAINNKITTQIFKYLNENGVKTHFVKKLSEREQLVKKVNIIPLEVVVRNVVAGSLKRRTGLTEGAEILPSLVEFYYKDDDLGDPLLNKGHIKLLNLASRKELMILEDAARKINVLLRNFFEAKDIIIVDFKLEFGYDMNNEIILADEISPDTCRLWDATTKKKLDKDGFRFDLGNLTESYKFIEKRLGA